MSSSGVDGAANPALGPDTDAPAGEGLELAQFAAGCFWSVELVYQRLPGVVRTEVGHSQGQLHEPAYRDVCGGGTGHVEVVRVHYDPEACPYPVLLDVFWAKHNPTTLNRQKCLLHSSGKLISPTLDDFNTACCKPTIGCALKEDTRTRDIRWSIRNSSTNVQRRTCKRRGGSFCGGTSSSAHMSDAPSKFLEVLAVRGDGRHDSVSMYDQTKSPVTAELTNTLGYSAQDSLDEPQQHELHDYKPSGRTPLHTSQNIS